jgi:signal transduction histidine kinase
VRSIGARLTFWYAFAATITFAILSLIGGVLLDTQLTHGLDELNAAEFRQLKAHIGDDYATVSRGALEQRLTGINQYESVLFLISIHYPKTDEYLFNSSNLHGQRIPDVKGQRKFDAFTPELGSLRVNEFLLPPYDVTVATSARAVDSSIRAYGETSAALIAFMLLASIAIGLGLSRLVLRPMRAIRDTADRIGSDNLSERIPVGDVRDEVSDLAELLNRTFDRLESAFVQMRRFSEEVSHELKTPLSLIRLHAEEILRDGGGPHADAAIEQVDEIARLNRFIDQMLFLSRADADAIAFDLKPIDPRSFLESFAHDASVLAEDSGHVFTFTASDAGSVAMEPGWLRQVLLNAVTNAFKATPRGGQVCLSASFAGSMWQVSIEDDGKGVPASERDRMFERFVRLGGVDTPRGTGLGLTISRSIVRLHGGRIWAEPARRLRGLAIIVELPRVAAVTATEGDPP